MSTSNSSDMPGLSRLEEVRVVEEKTPCLGVKQRLQLKMWTQRRVGLDLLMACWGLGTWLGVNGLYVQLPLLVERLPEGWALPASMVLAVQLANIGLVIYALLRRYLPKVSDAPYIYGLLTIGTLSLLFNGFFYTTTTFIGSNEVSIVFLAMTFSAALVGCTSSVLFYPYLRHYRDVYLATYLAGEGLSGFIPSILALIQGVGGNPSCVPSADNSTLVAVYPPARFDTLTFMVVLAVLSALSLISFTAVDSCKRFMSERVMPSAAEKDEEASSVSQLSLLTSSWLIVLCLMGVLNALSNGVLPSVQSYSCMPYGTVTYHLAVTLSAMANPAACLAGVWLKPVPAQLLAIMLAGTLLPFSYIIVTAAMSPMPPLLGKNIGTTLVVLSWVLTSAVVSYARMWVYAWARRGGARGMRACGTVTQIGSALGSLVLFILVNYAGVFVQPDASNSRLYVTIHYSWLLVDNDVHNETKLEDFLDDVALLPDTKFVYSSLDTTAEIYRAKYNTPLLKTDWGVNNSATPHQLAALQITRRLTERRKTLNVSLTAGVVIEQPSQFMGWNDLSNAQVDPYAKFTYPLLMYLAEDLNISYNIYQVDIYGALSNDSQWSGLCGLFQRRRIELGLASLLMRADRLRLLDYVADGALMRSSFMFRQPAQSSVSNMFLLPFSRGVWAAVVVAFVASSLFLALGSRPLRRVHPALDMLTTLETLTFCIGAICQQGTFLNPRPQSVRMVMLVSLVTSVFAFTSYSAKIVAILQSPSTAMKTLEDLTASPIACGIQETTYKTRYYTESTDPVIKKFYTRKIQPQGDKAFMSVVDGISRMRRQFFAFQVEVEAGYQIIRKTFTEEEKCGVSEVDAIILPRTGIPIRKYSGYKNLMAARLRWHREIGLFARTRAIWMPRKPQCEARGIGFVSPGLHDLQPAVKVLLYGVVWAVVLLVAEIGWYKVPTLLTYLFTYR